jgi:hypothetical protein
MTVVFFSEGPRKKKKARVEDFGAKINKTGGKRRNYAVSSPLQTILQKLLKIRQNVPLESVPTDGKMINSFFWPAG